MGHPADRAFETQHQAALEVVLGAPQLQLRHRPVFQATDLLHHEIDDLTHHVRVAAGVDGQGSRISIRAQVAAHRVGEPAFLPHVLEQARAHRAAKHGVEDVADVPVFVILRVAARSKADVTLLELLVSDQQLGHDGRRRVPHRLALRLNRTEGAADQLPEPIVLHVSGRRHDEVAGHIGPSKVLAKRLLGERPNRLAGAKNGSAERVALPEMLGEQLVHQVVGRVLDHLDLFDDHLFLALDVFLVKRRVEHDIRKNIDGTWQVFVEHLDVVAGTLLGRERIQQAAHRIDLLGDALRRPRRRAFEQHMLDEVRNTAPRLVFMPGATRQPDADADRPHVRHRLGEKTEAVGENLANDHDQVDTWRPYRPSAIGAMPPNARRPP